MVVFANIKKKNVCLINASWNGNYDISACLTNFCLIDGCLKRDWHIVGRRLKLLDHPCWGVPFECIGSYYMSACSISTFFFFFFLF